MDQSADFPFCIEDVVQLVGLRIRRPCGDGVYTDCPFCGDNRGKLKVNYEKNVWKCNYCQTGGGMLQLYAGIKNTSTSVAYREICEAIQNGIIISSQTLSLPRTSAPRQISESKKADAGVIHKTYTAMLEQLLLKKEHLEHLRSVRGLSDAEIDRLGFRSTPPFYMCRSITERLIGLGHTVQGVPGFYQKDGKWTLNFCSYTAGILLPAKDYEGRISGFQIRLDTPLKNGDDTSDKPGAKYIWLSSSGKQNGCSSGSPVHLIGERNAKTIYVTEGVLKADIAHCLTGRTFAAIAGANNLTSLEDLFKVISRTGTQLIVEAHDMDKYKNEMVDKGASAIRQLANKYGMDCKRLTWNPNYKGIDDWQLALRRKSQKKEREQMTFRDRFMHGLCDFEELDDEITTWHESSEHAKTLPDYLGLSDEEYAMCAENDSVLQKHLLTRRTHQYFRIYQLDFDDDHQTKKFAFDGIDALRKAGYEQPPAAEYRLVCDDYIPCDMTESDVKRLDFLFLRYNDTLPENYHGRSISPSNVVELYDEEKRRYYYRDRDSFCPVKFSPFLAKPMKQG